MRQLVYAMFIRDNCASFHLWWKENLVKHQKVSKYSENDCGLGVTIEDLRGMLENKNYSEMMNKILYCKTN